LKLGRRRQVAVT